MNFAKLHRRSRSATPPVEVNQKGKAEEVKEAVDVKHAILTLVKLDALHSRQIYVTSR